MSTDLTSATYNEAEKGTVDATSSLPVLHSDEKNVVAVKVTPVEIAPPKFIEAKEKGLDAPKKPTPKPKKKVSKWILWTLWFNTYRYIII